MLVVYTRGHAEAWSGWVAHGERSWGRARNRPPGVGGNSLGWGISFSRSPVGSCPDTGSHGHSPSFQLPGTGGWANGGEGLPPGSRSCQACRAVVLTARGGSTETLLLFAWWRQQRPRCWGPRTPLEQERRMLAGRGRPSPLPAPGQPGI